MPIVSSYVDETELGVILLRGLAAKGQGLSYKLMELVEKAAVDRGYVM
ncbi:hypothetical protein [Pseudobutyrivibrio ruminis]|nr:hypothetical protein [Pseudobutyrivibrio ruminis]